jgi:hypothetical protein
MSAADLASAAALDSEVVVAATTSVSGLVIFTCSLGGGDSFALNAFCSAVTLEN